MTQLVHNKIIGKEAARIFKPYGIKRKGQSRTFLDDHGWYVIVIELQPSSYRRGTYLNIGVNFNWFLSDHFDFDMGYRVDFEIKGHDEYIEFINEEQFTECIDLLCEKALQVVQGYRDALRTIKCAEKTVITQYDHSTIYTRKIWRNYNSGIISGIAGNRRNLNKYFKTLLTEIDVLQDERPLWNNLKNTANDLLHAANNDLNAFKAKIVDIIKETRKLKKLDEREIVFE